MIWDAICSGGAANDIEDNFVWWASDCWAESTPAILAALGGSSNLMLMLNHSIIARLGEPQRAASRAPQRAA